MLRNMEYVYEVYKQGSFTKAAKSLYVSQPCLSALVKKTEEKLGFPIFNRNSNPLQLTECGQEYIRYIERMRALENEFDNYLNDLRGLKTGKLSIGSNSAFSSLVLPQIISDFNRLYPGVKVTLNEGNIYYLEEKLLNGDLDLVLDNHPMDEKIYRKELFSSEMLLLAVPKSAKIPSALQKFALEHHDVLEGRQLLTQTYAVNIRDFMQNSFIALRHGNDTRIRMDMICEQSGFSPKNSAGGGPADHRPYNIVCSNMGITLVSDTLITHTAPVPGSGLSIELDSEQLYRHSYFYYKNSSYVTRAMREFIRTGTSSFARSYVFPK